jgi:hypothetical protein
MFGGGGVLLRFTRLAVIELALTEARVLQKMRRVGQAMRRKKSVWDYTRDMEKICIASVAVFLGFIAYYLAYATGRSGSTCVILGLLIGAYGAWLGEQLFTKIHH